MCPQQLALPNRFQHQITQGYTSLETLSKKTTINPLPIKQLARELR